MQVKKERTHQCGLTNIDFKRLRDSTSLQKFKDDMRSTDFGTMGRTKVPYEFERCGFGNRQSMQVHCGFKAPEPPNPRLGETQKLYQSSKKPLLLPSNVQKTRTRLLEEYPWSEKVFTGENVSHRNWYNSQVTSPKELDGEKQTFGSTGNCHKLGIVKSN